MSEFDDMPDDEREKLHNEATMTQHALRLRCLEHAVGQIYDAVGVTIDGSTSFQDYLQKLFLEELNGLMKHLSRANPSEASRLLRYIEDLEPREIGGEERSS